MKSRKTRKLFLIMVMMVAILMGLIVYGIFAVLNEKTDCRAMVKVHSKKNNTILLEYFVDKKRIEREEFDTYIQEVGDVYMMDLPCDDNTSLNLVYNELTFVDTVSLDSTFARIMDSYYCSGILVNNLSWIAPQIRVEYYINEVRFERIFEIHRDKLDRIKEFIESDSVVQIIYSISSPINSQVVYSDEPH